jgi:hypothetical protein
MIFKFKSSTLFFRFPFFRHLPKSIFQKKKRKKRKQANHCGHREKAKGNGIIGGDPLGEETVYAVVF